MARQYQGWARSLSSQEGGKQALRLWHKKMQDDRRRLLSLVASKCLTARLMLPVRMLMHAWREHAHCIHYQEYQLKKKLQASFKRRLLSYWYRATQQDIKSRHRVMAVELHHAVLLAAEDHLEVVTSSSHTPVREARTSLHLTASGGQQKIT